MVRLYKKYQLIYLKDTILNVLENAITELDERIYSYFEHNSRKQIEKFIEENNLSYPVEITNNPFDRPWDERYPLATVRLYVSSIEGNNISIDIPWFVMLLEGRNIKLFVDKDYEVVWAYCEYIEDEYAELLDMVYDAKFEYR